MRSADDETRLELDQGLKDLRGLLAGGGKGPARPSAAAGASAAAAGSDDEDEEMDDSEADEDEDEDEDEAGELAQVVPSGGRDCDSADRLVEGPAEAPLGEERAKWMGGGGESDAAGRAGASGTAAG